MKRSRIALGQGFWEPSHRLAEFDNYDDAMVFFKKIVAHPRRKHFAELYFVQPCGTPETVAHTKI